MSSQNAKYKLTSKQQQATLNADGTFKIDTVYQKKIGMLSNS